MQLKLLCPEDFPYPKELADEVQSYLPRLINQLRIVPTNSFEGTMQVESVKERLLKIAEPDWKKDIVINLIDGRVRTGPRRINSHAYPIDKFTRESTPALFKINSLPKGGHIVLGNFEQDGLKGDVPYLAKLAVEQFHSKLGVLPHDEECFSYFDKIGALEPEEHKSDFCSKCKEFLSSLEDPLRYDEISELKREIYSVGIRDYWKFVRNH